MFGAAKTTPAAGTLFSSTPATGLSGGLFGQQQQAQQQPPAGGGGLFGQQPQQQQQQPAAGGGLFGAKPAGTTGGLFGNASTAASAAPGTSLFGQPAAGAAGGTGAAKPAFSFGGTAPPAQSTGTGLFGQPQQQQQQPQQQQTQPAPGGGLFGGFGQNQATTSAQPQTSGLFGQQQQQQRPGGLLGSTFAPSGLNPGGTSMALPPNQSLGVQVAAPPQNPFLSFPFQQKERFNELPDQQKQMVEQLDQFIKQQVQVRKQLEADKKAEEISRRCQAIYTTQSDLKSLSALIDTEEISIRDLRSKVEGDRNDTNTMFEIGVNWQQGSDNSHLRSFPLNYFARAVADIAVRLTRYKNTLEEIQRQLISIGHRDTYTPDAIQNAIQAQNTSFMALATKVAAVHTDIQVLKGDYISWYQQQHHSLRDPFSMQPLEAAVP